MKESTLPQELQRKKHNWNAATNSLFLHFFRQCFLHKHTGLMDADGHYTWQVLSCKNIQTFYAQCQNYTLLRIPEDNRRIISTHIHTHTLSK